MRAKLIFKMEKVYKSIKSLAFIQLTNQPKLWVFFVLFHHVLFLHNDCLRSEMGVIICNKWLLQYTR